MVEKSFFFHLFSLSVLNSYILYKERTRSPVLQRVFRRELVKELVSSFGLSTSLTPRGHPRSSAEGLSRLQAGKHFPEKIQGTGKKSNITRSCGCLFSCPKEDFSKNRRKEEETRKGVQFSVQCLQSGTLHSRLFPALP